MEKSVEPLPCHDPELADRDTFRALQREDQSLRKFWKQVGEERNVRHGKVKFVEKKDLLYRIFVPEKTGNEVRQLV